MTPGPAPERRGHERTDRSVEFYCYVDGQRFDSESLDISAGGALLRTEDDIPQKVPVIVVPKSANPRKSVIMLVGTVVRRQQKPAGIGIRWSKCVSRKGIRPIARLFEFFPELVTRKPPNPDLEVASAARVAYSFVNNRFYVPVAPNLPGAGSSSRPAPSPRPAPAPTKPPPAIPPAGPKTQPEAAKPLDASPPPAPPPVPTKPSPTMPPLVQRKRRSPTEHQAYRRTPETGPITSVIRHDKAQIPVALPARVRADGPLLKGMILMIASDSLFVQCDTAGLENLAPAAKVTVELVMELPGREFPAELSCSLLAVAEDPRTGANGLALNIIAADCGKRGGLFERYVKFLYNRMIVEQ